jgi:hypothetical protein
LRLMANSLELDQEIGKLSAKKLALVSILLTISLCALRHSDSRHYSIRSV